MVIIRFTVCEIPTLITIQLPDDTSLGNWIRLNGIQGVRGNDPA
jgi:hypothetical protein